MMVDMHDSREDRAIILFPEDDRRNQQSQRVPAATDREDKMTGILSATGHAKPATNLVNQLMTSCRQRYGMSGF